MDNYHSATTFIQAISAEVLTSAAVNHPYLTALSEGDLPNIDLAFKDFAFQYGVYSAGFTRYVSAVIDNLSNASHQQILLANLTEEQGDSHDFDLPPGVLACVAGQPHTSLYRRFQDALGVDGEYRQTNRPCQTSLQWKQQFLQLCKLNEYVGVGAIGIGTELLVAHIYKQILAGLQSHSQLTLNQRVFFDLHSECDEEHAAQLLLIAEALAQDRAGCEKIAYGARQAIKLRVAFWDNMLERAYRFPAREPAFEETSAIEY